MDIMELARRLYGTPEPDDRWVQEANSERDYLQTKLDEMDDDGVYEMDELDCGWCITRYTVAKRTPRFIYLAANDPYSRGFRLPRQPLEAGESVYRRYRRFQLGRTIRPRIEQLLESYEARITSHDAAARQRARNRRRWGMPLTDDQVHQVTQFALALGIRGAATCPSWTHDPFGTVNWSVEGF